MLDDREFKKIARLFGGGMRASWLFRKRHGLPSGPLDADARFAPVRRRYEELTGWKNMHQNAIAHHRISLYGPPCRECGKPLRTPRASFCAACGETVSK